MSGSARATCLDHVALVAADPAALHGAFERLGFTLTPLARQSGRLRADGPLEPWGTANRCAMLREGYLELQAITDPALPTNGLDRFLARYQGLHNATFGMDDEHANLARLRRARLDIPGILTLERPVDDADPTGPTARFARLPLPDAEEGRLQLVRHLTPETIWQDRFLDHPNRAVALETLIMAAERPATTAAKLSALTGWPVIPDPAGGFRLDLPRGTVRVLTTAGLSAVLPDLAPPCLPFMAGIVLRTDDGAAAARRHSPEGHATPHGWCVLAGGAAIVFH